MKQRLLPLAAAALLGTAGCAGVSTGGVSPGAAPSATPQLVDAAQYASALRAAAPDLAWPRDYAPDVTVLAARSGPPKGAFAVAGGERFVLAIVNRCAWYRSWDDARARGDAKAAANALDVMTTVLPSYSPEDPDGQAYAAEAARLAANGDATMARKYVTANCDPVLFGRA